MKLENDVIIITGSSRGLGKAIANEFVNEGAQVACSSRTRSTLEDTVGEINDGPGDAVAIPADIRSWENIQALVKKTRDIYGSIDVLVNNAALGEVALTDGEKPPVADLPVDVWKTIIETNLNGPFLCSRAVLPEMRERGHGRLVHLSSGMGLEGRANWAAYVASKFGLEGFHESLTEEVQGTGIQSMILEPGGGVNTEGFSKHLSEKERTRRLNPEVITEPAVLLAAGEGKNGGRYVATSVNGRLAYGATL